MREECWLAPVVGQEVGLKAPVPAGRFSEIPCFSQLISWKVQQQAHVAVVSHAAACGGALQKKPPAMLAGVGGQDGPSRRGGRRTPCCFVRFPLAQGDDLGHVAMVVVLGGCRQQSW